MKKTLAIIGVGVAFLAVSLWVWLSQGQSAKAVRAKFRLGGVLLTLTGMMTLGSCEATIDCYDPSPSNVIYVKNVNDGSVVEVRDGQTLTICTLYLTVEEIVVSIYDNNSLELQSESFGVDSATREIPFTLDVADYIGEAEMVIGAVVNDSVVPYYSLYLNVVK